jgi:TRAP-type C4-dicarboxylate transport system substrate-binding protein
VNRLAALLLASATMAATAHADPIVLRMASVSPEGTAWARELRAFARDVSTSIPSMQVKWYLGGIAGDEVMVAERIKRDQLDGIGSGGMLCERISPTMRAVHMLAETREESNFVLNRVLKDVDEEMRKNGYVYLGGAGLGPDLMFTREPVRSVDDLRKYKLWAWDLDEVSKVIYPAFGMKVVPLPIYDAYKAYEDRHIDGFVSVPAAALAFQWSAETHYVSDLSMGFVNACVVVTQRAFDQIPAGSRDAFRAAGAKLQGRFEDVGRQQDDALFKGGLFARQGLRMISASTDFVKQYEQAAMSAHRKLAESLVPRPQLERVQSLLDEYRARKR